MMQLMLKPVRQSTPVVHVTVISVYTPTHRVDVEKKEECCRPPEIDGNCRGF